MSKFNRGDIVWGKMKFFSWWPAMVLDPGDCGIKNRNPNKYVLFWFADYNISQVVKENIAPFQAKFPKFAKRERIQEAITEALTVLASANDLTFDTESALVKWAGEGFPATANWEVKFRWTKLDLPQLIQKALPEKPEASSDEDDTKDDVKKMIAKVLKGEKSLEEICIGCCKENATLVQSHPLFLGKVCAKCKKDVDRVNNLPCGVDHKYCIVCGQGGCLVYCSQRMCSRAFCKECIHYLDYEDSFTKIAAVDKWLCYLCQPIKKENCLIRKRATKRKIQSPVPDTAPVSKKARQDRTNSRIDRVITAVMIGIKDLDDICIACCKEGVELVCNHPLFIGKICKKCKKDVMKVWSLPSGKFHNFCIVCGQGGSIVYCSNDVCSRAFCKECIEYLDWENRFYEIISSEWQCYLCKPQDCLIRKRVIKQEIKDTAPNQVSVIKSVKQKVQKPVPNRMPVSKSRKQKVQNSAPSRVSASKSKYHARSDSSLGDVIFKLVSGRIHLEDVCIACCREGVELLCKHPLFIGKICKRCKKDVMKICNLPIGKCQDFCVVCGQGGSLAYCSSDRCLRAYCKQCVEYLDDGEWAYEEIVKAEDWFCYLCKPNLNKNCLIKKREIHEGLVDTPPTSPDVKFPENSIDSDEIATAFDSAAKDGRFVSVSDNITTSSDNAADNRRFAHFIAADSSESSFYIKEEPSDSTADDEKSMDYSAASAYDSSVEDKAFENCLAATTPKKSSSKKASAANNVVDDKAVGNGFAATLSKTSSTKKGKSSSSIVIREVKEGKRYLEDICIACRKIDAYVLTDHPLLIGVICCHCYLDVLAVCNDLLPKDRVNFCVICGQESVNLLCCSYKDCSRAYCKICVEYLDSKEAFAINVEDKNWICYLSEAYKKYRFKEDKFLIKQRSPIKHREYRTRHDRLRRKTISKVEGDLKMNVREGVVKVEDICIACHKGEYELMEKSNIDLVVHHPLFFGSICESCVHDVATVCKLPCGKIKDLCIVCGQHGYLVYCSKEECSRAYCRKCIEFLDSEVAFNKILKTSHWQCYFCQFCKNRKCIIRRRFPPDNYTYDGDAKLELYTPQQSTEDNKKKLWAGELTLKDVCIACLELIVDYPMPHPLFKGKVCLKCLNDVHKASSLRSGTMHDQCVVCGQGGELIYCSNRLCLKAYCKPCIECLDVEKAYSEILENENWFCYFCDLHPPSKCFIQRKDIHKKGTKKFPEVPKAKDRPPIYVLATNDQGEHALKKAKIEVNMYNTDRRPLPSLLGQAPVLYDLVLGSFFVEDKEKQREKLCEDFFRSFDHFNNRRLHYGFHDVDHELYYIFIGDYLIMDGDMLTKIAEKIHVQRQFHTILPVLFEFGERKFLAWSNLSYCMPPGRAEADEGPYIDKRLINAGRYIDNQTVEKEICYFFVKYLQKYFKSEA